ncbi:MAG: polysaccharide deacetylase family protein [Thermodesulfobacteriota bacterium]
MKKAAASGHAALKDRWESMENDGDNIRKWSLAEKTGLAAIGTAALLTAADPLLAVLPLGAFLLLCLAAPFFTRLSFYLPIISRGTSGKQVVALTFDDGPDPVSTPELLRLLDEHRVPATFFVSGHKAAAHPELIREIIRRGHDLGNHSYSHDIFIMFKGRKALRAEIEATQRILGAHGIQPLTFRPPVGITNPLLGPVLKGAGMFAVNFSCRAADLGNRRIRKLADRILNRIRPDDIVVLHDIRPADPELLPYWLKEIERMIAGIEAKGLAVVPLANIIGRPVMGPSNP